jgi:superoxide dismutase, Fe-Mn family
MAFTLPNLPYAYDALGVSIDAQTMEIHHGKHHNTYVSNLNAALTNHPDFEKKSIDELVRNLNNVPAEVRTAVRNNGGGHWNHSFFWEIMTPNSTKKPVGKLAEAIEKRFSTFERFKEEFAKAGAGRFGSGWAWLIKKEGELQIVSTPNQDNPIMDLAEVQGTPVLGLDVWEHAYYLRYQNRRPEYINAFWDVVNWERAEAHFNQG